MLLGDNHWRFSEKLYFLKKLSERPKPFLKNWSFIFLVEGTEIENATFPYKTALSKANVKTIE